jgi:hypothetical protein
MRAAYHLAFAVFSLGTVATPTTAPNATDQTEAVQSAQHHAVPDAIRNIAADSSARLAKGRMASSEIRLSRDIAVGESLPETIELHPIPNHETYRYAVVNDHRVVVDAMSRKVVYVLR